MKSLGGYSKLLRDGGFQAFLWTQFLAAFNDNVYKMIVSIMAVAIAADPNVGSRYLSLAGAVFVIPFLLFAGPAGQIADRFSKTRVLQITKAFEIPVMAFGIVALLAHRIDLLLIVLFCLAAQANFFSPAKYGILPEIAGEEQLARANGLIELSTFAAIVLGSSVGTLLFAYWKHTPLRMGITLLTLAVVGSLTSLRITKTPPAGSREPFHWNPFREILTGARTLRRHRAMWLTVAGISYFWFIGALFQMTIMLFSSETLHASEKTTGLLVTALAAGIGIGSVLAGRLCGDRIEMGIVVAGSGLLGVFALFTGMSTSLGWALIWLTGLGVAGGLFIVPLNAFLQDRAGAAEKGRILTTNNFVNMLGVVLASGALSLLHDVLHIGAAGMMLILGLFTTIGTVGVIALMPGVTLRYALWVTLNTLFRVRYVGSENIPQSGGGVVISNHVSFADAVIVGGATGRFMRFLMWQPYYENKYFRPFFDLLKAIPLSTSNAKDALRALRKAREEAARGDLVAIFPEGAITRTGNLNSFQSGVERLIGDHTPVIPVYIDGLWGHPLTMRGGGLFKSWTRAWRPRITVYVGQAERGPASAAQLRMRVMELSSRAMELRKTPEYTVAHRFIAVARRNWSKVAFDGSSVTYGKALIAAMAVRIWLDDECAGQRHIGILLPDAVDSAIANIGVELAGRVAVNFNREELCGVKTVLTSRLMTEMLRRSSFMDTLRARFGRWKPALLPGDAACVIFPNGIELSHGALLAAMEALEQVSDGCKQTWMPWHRTEGYSLPEMAGTIAINRPDIPQADPPQLGTREGSVGRTLPGVAVRIVNPETMEPRECGEEGLLLVKGPSMMTGYWNDADRTARSMHDGYFITRDIARMDDDGFLYIVR